MPASSLINEIKNPCGRIFRRLKIKRRVSGTGLYEDDWQDISQDVKSFGKIKSSIDSARLNRFQILTNNIKLMNNDGKYNPADDQNSLWYGYMNQQRTLVQIEAGFIHQTTTAEGIVFRYEYPTSSEWDKDYWDSADWDGSNIQYTGIISGSIYSTPNNEMVFPIKPVTEVFRTYAASNINGYNSSITASGFLELVRDQVDANSNYIFRPFFGDTTTNWEISTTTTMYQDLNTSTSEALQDKSVWDVIEKLSEAEDFIPYITREGVFQFKPRDPSTDVKYVFSGIGHFNRDQGQTIKKINKYGSNLERYYSRVLVKFVNEDTNTSYVLKESAMEVGSANTAWALGESTFNLENFWIADSATAESIATTIFNEYSSLKKEIDFVTTFIPHLEVLDKLQVYYDSTMQKKSSLWDLNNWAADDTDTADDLIFDDSVGDAIKLDGQEFKFLSIDIDLDKFECRYIARGV